MFFIYLFFIGIVWVILVFINDLVKIIKKEDSKYLGILLTMLSLSFIGLITFWFLQNIGNPFDFSSLSKEETPRAALGALGDYFGGLLNLLFAFLSFMGVLWTLKMTKEELLESRDILKEQLKTQDLQRFDSFFATLLSELSRKIENLYPNKIEVLEGKIFESYSSNESKRKLIMQDREFSMFSILLYQILKTIDEDLPEENKKRYSNIVRSIVPNSVLQLLMIKCHIDTNHHNFDAYMDLLERFSFFEHISLYEDNNLCKSSVLLSTSTFYEQSAFGQNRAIQDFRKSFLFESFKKNNNFVDILLDMDIGDIKNDHIKEQHPKDKSDNFFVDSYTFTLIFNQSYLNINLRKSQHLASYTQLTINNQLINNFYLCEKDNRNLIGFFPDDTKQGYWLEIRLNSQGKLELSQKC